MHGVVTTNAKGTNSHNFTPLLKVFKKLDLTPQELADSLEEFNDLIVKIWPRDTSVWSNELSNGHWIISEIKKGLRDSTLVK